MFTIFFKTIILYALIIVGLRLMGKRQLGELQPSEFVVTILISNIATLPIEDVDIPLLTGILPILTLVSCEVIMSTVALKSKRARKILSGSPKIVIRDGVIDQRQLRDLRFSIDDLMEQLRQNNVFDIADVAFAIVETTGKVSVYQKFEARNVTAEMLNLPSDGQESAPPVVMISDGQLIEEALRYCNLRHEWLEKTLGDQKVRLEDIFLMTCNRQANYHIIKKEKVA
ncbi:MULTISPECIES: DUF421 domain-containing protein [Oscillospiraceae]|uniref:Uncharacterized membrane protein YcaP (DUF421 family) n=1 Tax=Harryflintia acetispora TaxID=1849041 RepID=A0A9X8UK82_9FIRM|nr:MULTISPECIES: DUF421 domain-containing protein [Oscillospiraceae]TCL43995.1 uncharacterized membrane protein YcaP (DUF421 family) [Harryflintia acetispora]